MISLVQGYNAENLPPGSLLSCIRRKKDSRKKRIVMNKAIFIGASSGIGYALTRVLSENGYTVGIMARWVHLLDELAKRVKGTVFIKRIDASDTGSAMKALSDLIEEMDGADLVVISAGAGEINANLSWDLENETIRTNVSGFSALVNIAMKHFMQKSSGHLVGISSIAALRGGRESPAYNASKAFESNYLEGLRQKVRKFRLSITIADIRPGFVKTVMAKGEGIFWAAKAEEAAEQIYQAIRRRKSITYITKRWLLIAWIMRMLPAFVYERL